MLTILKSSPLRKTLAYQATYDDATDSAGGVALRQSWDTFLAFLDGERRKKKQQQQQPGVMMLESGAVVQKMKEAMAASFGAVRAGLLKVSPIHSPLG